MPDKDLNKYMSQKGKEQSKSSLEEYFDVKGQFIAPEGLDEKISVIEEQEQKTSNQFVDESENITNDLENNDIILQSNIELDSVYDQKTPAPEVIENMPAPDDVAATVENTFDEEHSEETIVEKQPKKRGKKVIKTVLVIIAILLLFSFLAIAWFMFEKNISLDVPELRLKTSAVELEYGDEFNIQNYIEYATPGATITYSPDVYEKQELGEVIVTVKAKKGIRTAKVEIVVNLQDTQAPTFELKTESIEIAKNEINKFNCMDYVDYSSMKDNYDVDGLQFLTKCPTLTDEENINGAIINYTLSDKSGNKCVRTLTVKINEGEE